MQRKVAHDFRYDPRRITAVTFLNIATTVHSNKMCDSSGFTTITIREEYRMQISTAPQFDVIRSLLSFFFNITTLRNRSESILPAIHLSQSNFNRISVGGSLSHINLEANLQTFEIFFTVSLSLQTL